MYVFLDKLNSKNIRFALSNVLKSNNKENEILKDWLENNNYKVHNLDFNYNNSSYQKKDKTSDCNEILVCNY